MLYYSDPRPSTGKYAGMFVEKNKIKTHQRKYQPVTRLTTSCVRTLSVTWKRRLNIAVLSNAATAIRPDDRAICPACDEIASKESRSCSIGFLR